jgi:hypothetical protein
MAQQSSRASERARGVQVVPASDIVADVGVRQLSRIPIFFTAHDSDRMVDAVAHSMHIMIALEPSDSLDKTEFYKFRLLRQQGFAPLAPFILDPNDLIGRDGQPITLAAYRDLLTREEARPPDRVRRRGALPASFEDRALRMARVVAAEDEMLTQHHPELFQPAWVDEMIRVHYDGECAMRALRTVVQTRPDWTPPRYLLSSVCPSPMILGIVSEDLLGHYNTTHKYRTGPPTLPLPVATGGQRERFEHMRHYAAGAFLKRIADDYDTRFEEMFPPFEREGNERAFDTADLFSDTQQGLHRAHIIPLGLLPLVMAQCDPTFLALNPVSLVCGYALEYTRALSRTVYNPEYCLAQVAQLEHNLRWYESVQRLEAHPLAPLTRLPSVTHANIATRIVLYHKAALTAYRKLTQDPAMERTVRAFADQYVAQELGSTRTRDPVGTYLGHMHDAPTKTRHSEVRVAAAKKRWDTERKRVRDLAAGSAAGPSSESAERPTKKQKRDSSEKKHTHESEEAQRDDPPSSFE